MVQRTCSAVSRQTINRCSLVTGAFMFATSPITAHHSLNAISLTSIQSISIVLGLRGNIVQSNETCEKDRNECFPESHLVLWVPDIHPCTSIWQQKRRTSGRYRVTVLFNLHHVRHHGDGGSLDRCSQSEVVVIGEGQARGQIWRRPQQWSVDRRRALGQLALSRSSCEWRSIRPYSLPPG